MAEDATLETIKELQRKIGFLEEDIIELKMRLGTEERRTFTLIDKLGFNNDE